MDKSIDVLIDKYVNNSASTEEIRKIENLIDSDSNIAKEVKFRLELKSVTHKADEEMFMSSLDKLAIRPNKKNMGTNLYWISAVAAAVVISFIAYNFWTNQTSNDVFATHYEPYRNVVKPIERGEIEMDSLTQAFFYYENKEYDNAQNYLENLAQEKKSPILDFYLAMIAIEQENFDIAYNLLEQYANGPEPKLYTQSLWYRALLNIKQNNIILAKTQLQELIDLGDFNKEIAENILQAL